MTVLYTFLNNRIQDNLHKLHCRLPKDSNNTSVTFNMYDMLEFCNSNFESKKSNNGRKINLLEFLKKYVKEAFMQLYHSKYVLKIELNDNYSSDSLCLFNKDKILCTNIENAINSIRSTKDLLSKTVNIYLDLSE